MHAGIDFLEFKPSEIALAVAMSVSGVVQAADINKAILAFPYMEKVIQKALKKRHLCLLGCFVLNVCFLGCSCRRE